MCPLFYCHACFTVKIIQFIWITATPPELLHYFRHKVFNDSKSSHLTPTLFLRRCKRDPVSHIHGFKGSVSFSVLNQVIFYTMEECSLGIFPIKWFMIIFILALCLTGFQSVLKTVFQPHFPLVLLPLESNRIKQCPLFYSWLIYQANNYSQ